MCPQGPQEVLKSVRTAHLRRSQFLSTMGMDRALKAVRQGRWEGVHSIASLCVFRTGKKKENETESLKEKEKRGTRRGRRMTRIRGNVITRATPYEQQIKFTEAQDESYETDEGTSVTVACRSVHTSDMAVPQDH